jgi:fucose 4-O-acetylase-like acetyltransferase
MIKAAVERRRLPLNAIKAILIFAIVTGHNRILIDDVPNLFLLLYFWHVQGFFYIAALSRVADGRPISFSTAISRYMTPFVILVSTLSIAKSLATHALPAALPQALISGAADACDAATGLALFWFLPTLISFLLLIQLLGKLAGSMSGRVIIFAFAMFCPVIAYVIPRGVLDYAPLNVGVALYLIPGSFLFILGVKARAKSRAFGIAIVIASAAAVVFQVWMTVRGQSKINVAVFQVGASPWQLYFAVIASVAANLIVLEVAEIINVNATVKAVGSASLYIYLFHQAFQTAGTMIIARILRNHQTYLVPAAMVVVPISIAAALAVRAILVRFPRINGIFFPKDAKSLLSDIKGGHYLDYKAPKTT